MGLMANTTHTTNHKNAQEAIAATMKWSEVHHAHAGFYCLRADLEQKTDTCLTTLSDHVTTGDLCVGMTLMCVHMCVQFVRVHACKHGAVPAVNG